MASHGQHSPDLLFLPYQIQLLLPLLLLLHLLLVPLLPTTIFLPSSICLPFSLRILPRSSPSRLISISIPKRTATHQVQGNTNKNSSLWVPTWKILNI